MAAGKSFEDDDVELIYSKSGLETLQSLTEALAATDSSGQQQSLLQAGLYTLYFALMWCHYTACGRGSWGWFLSVCTAVLHAAVVRTLPVDCVLPKIFIHQLV